MNPHEPILLKRDCPAVRIPSGEFFVLPKDSEVMITQSLGGSFTVATREGLAKIFGDHADALGIELAGSPTPAAAPGEDTEVSEEEVWEQLKTCYDPEIPVNIVDLGLIYDCKLTARPEGSGKLAEVKMTLTAPGCGMGPTIAREAEEKIMTLPGIAEAKVELVWDPPWNQTMISETGRMQLGLV